MTDRPERGLFDTSIVVDLETLSEARLPLQAAIATVTLAELAGGVHSARDPFERGARLLRLQLVESTFEGLPFDAAAARAYGHLVALVIAAGQSPRPRRLDLMIAATALAHELTFYTRNPKDFSALGEVLTVIAV